MRYVQQAAAAQNALEVLHSQVAELERELAAAKEVNGSGWWVVEWVGGWGSGASTHAAHKP